MSDFVEQCRREWKRLGVPDPLAEEMATDLAADFAEAESEGISAEEFLGNSVFDPSAFAASWAAERGIIPEPPGPKSARRRPLVLTAFTALAAITLIATALLLLTGNPKVSLARTTRPHFLPAPAGSEPYVAPPAGSVRPYFGPSRPVVQVVHSVSAAGPVEWILLLLAIAALGFAGWLWEGWGRSPPPAAPA
jgi:hypothetical protein